MGDSLNPGLYYYTVPLFLMSFYKMDAYSSSDTNTIQHRVQQNPILLVQCAFQRGLCPMQEAQACVIVSCFFHSKVTQLQDLRTIANLSYSFVADANTLNLNFTKQSSKYFIGKLANGRPKTQEFCLMRDKSSRLW